MQSYDKRMQSGDEVPVPQKEIYDGMSVRLSEKNFPTNQLTGSLDLRQDISTLKMTVQEDLLWSLCLKMWMPFIA
jgi:hypothetical protein